MPKKADKRHFAKRNFSLKTAGNYDSMIAFAYWSDDSISRKIHEWERAKNIFPFVLLNKLLKRSFFVCSLCTLCLRIATEQLCYGNPPPPSSFILWTRIFSFLPPSPAAVETIHPSPTSHQHSTQSWEGRKIYLFRRGEREEGGAWKNKLSLCPDGRRKNWKVTLKPKTKGGGGELD